MRVVAIVLISTRLAVSCLLALVSLSRHRNIEAIRGLGERCTSLWGVFDHGDRGELQKN